MQIKHEPTRPSPTFQVHCGNPSVRCYCVTMDLKSKRLIYLKAVLFGIIGLTAGAIIIIQAPMITTVVALLLCIWAFCRLYYFAFYVIEKYVDGDYRYAGLTSFVRYMLKKKQGKGSAGTATKD